MKRLSFLLIALFVIMQSYSQNRTKGYRGFVDLNTHFGIAETDVSSMYGITTTHGYQITPHIFVGAGIGFNYVNNTDNTGSPYSTPNDYMIPFYADFRATLLNNKITPYFDLKLGGHAKYIDGIGYYANPSIGVSFLISPKYALNFAGSILIFEYSKKDDAPYAAAGFTIGLEF